MKKNVKLLCILAMSFALCACGGKKSNEPKTAEFDSTITVKDFEISVGSDILTAEQLNGDTDQYEEFLTTDMTNYGDTVLCDVTLVVKDGYIQVVVPYTIKNVGKEEKTFKEFISLNYNDGYTYDASEQYWTMGGTDDWHQFTKGEHTSVSISPLSTLECKAYICVPEEVVTNEEAPLKVTIAGYEYTLR